jgi:hypothetical protein
LLSCASGWRRRSCINAMIWLALSLGAVSLCAVLLFLWRLSDVREERIVWEELVRIAGKSDSTFNPSAITALPAAAQRYFRYTIATGTPLVSVVEIEMEGQLGLGTKAEPAYRAMTAHEVLVPPKGLVWKLSAGLISGSDIAKPDTSWTRFWLLNLIPIVRVSGTSDHRRSAFGRVVAEGAFWVPSSLLPGDHIAWEAVDDNAARAIVSYGEYSQSIELTIEADGRPSQVVIQRWSNENPENVFREQPFGGYLSDFREVNGYRLPMRVEGGNLIGTEEYFPFFKANVREIHFPQLDLQAISGQSNSQ